MRLTGGQALKTREESVTLTGFGKMWDPGDTVVVLYPLVWENGKPDLLVAAIWGHQINTKLLKSLKAIFIPSQSDIDENGKLKPGGKRDILHQFASISKQFLDGEKQSRINKLLEKRGLDESSRKSALDEIEYDYDTKNNPKAASPAVGRLAMLITTECVVIPLDSDGKPKVEEARLVTQTLSNDKIKKLLGIMKSADNKPDLDCPFLEVQYSFTAGVDKSQAGRVDPTGKVPEYRIANKYPELWPVMEAQVSSLPTESDTIEKRNMSYRGVDEKIIRQAITQYSLMNSEYLDSLKEDTAIDILVKNAEIIDGLRILENMSNTETVQKINEALAAKAALEAEGGVVAEEEVVEEKSENTSEEQESTGSPVIDELLKSTALLSDDVAEAVDLD